MHKRIFPILFAFVITISCALPTTVSEYLTPIPNPTSTLAVTPSPQATATPTAGPTLEPVERVVAADYAIAIGDYLRAVQENQIAFQAAEDPETKAAALYGMGRGQYFSGDYTAAESTFNQLILDYGESQFAANAHYFLGEIKEFQELYAQAAGHFEEYITLRPGVLDAYMNERRGDALIAARQHNEALQAYQIARDAPQLSDPVYIDIKIAKVYQALGDQDNAIRLLTSIYDTTTNDYTKATVNFLLGQSYIALGLPEQAYARYQDSVANFPLAYDSYAALVELVNAGEEVDEFSRGLIDYYVGQYAVAIEAFNRYIEANPSHDGTALHYRALSRQAMGEAEQAIDDWSDLIENYTTNRHWVTAWEEKAYTQWAYLDKYAEAAQTLLDFVALVPNSASSPDYLFQAGRIQERSGDLATAARTWERLINEYPSAELSARALFLAGVTLYRLERYQDALLIFQRFVVLSVTPADEAAGYLWTGKVQKMLGDDDAARVSWEQAAGRDPTGYYSERARELLAEEAPLTAGQDYNLDYNLEEERRLAEIWMRTTFAVPEDTDLNSLGPLASDGRIIRGNAYWEINLYNESLAEFEDLRAEIESDPVANFRLLAHLLDLGYYRQAILVSRQVLTLANFDDAGTFTAPIYFNHIRFGTYYQDLVLHNAAQEGFHPLLLFSVMRQESLFDGAARSSAGARGLMQIIPSTGQEVASEIGWPAGYTNEDLYRPLVNVRLGAHYLARQRNFFNGNLYHMLAAYNGGPGNANQWQLLAGQDPDLFLEVIRAAESRTYIMHIVENLKIYRRLYEPTETRE